MSNFCLSDYFYKLLGFNDTETKLIISRNEPNPDVRFMKGIKYEGLSSVDKALAESFDREFGSLVNPDPNAYMKKFR